MSLPVVNCGYLFMTSDVKRHFYNIFPRPSFLGIPHIEKGRLGGILHVFILTNLLVTLQQVYDCQ